MQIQVRNLLASSEGISIDPIGFLNQNSPAVQGVATVVLVLITAWYAFLTERLTSSAREQAAAAGEQTRLLAEQLKHQQRALEEQIAVNAEARWTAKQREQQAVRKLSIVVEDLHQKLRRFPRADNVPVGQIRSADTWTAEQIRDLETLAPILGDGAAEAAGKAAGSLRWLEERIGRIKSSRPGSPEAALLDRSIGQEWYPTLGAADTAIQQLSELLEVYRILNAGKQEGLPRA